MGKRETLGLSKVISLHIKPFLCAVFLVPVVLRAAQTKQTIHEKYIVEIATEIMFCTQTIVEEL